VAREGVVETITHLAFYAGRPDAVTTIAVARGVFKKTEGFYEDGASKLIQRALADRSHPY
jgi:hypothetical protein